MRERFAKWLAIASGAIIVAMATLFAWLQNP